MCVCVCVACQHSSSKFDGKNEHGKEITLSVRVSIARALVWIHMPVFVHLWLRSMCVRHSRVRRKIRSFHCRPTNERTPFARPFVSSDFFFRCASFISDVLWRLRLLHRRMWYVSSFSFLPDASAAHRVEHSSVAGCQAQWRNEKEPFSVSESKRDERCEIWRKRNTVQGKWHAQKPSAPFGLLFQREHFMFFDAICDYQMPELQHVGCIGRTADVNIKMSKTRELEIGIYFWGFCAWYTLMEGISWTGGQSKWNFIAQGEKEKYLAENFAFARTDKANFYDCRNDNSGMTHHETKTAIKTEIPKYMRNSVEQPTRIYHT